MYLEISGRMTGKTARLIKALIEHLDSDPAALAALWACNSGQVEMFKNLIPGEYHERVLCDCITERLLANVVRVNQQSLHQMLGRKDFGNSANLFHKVKYFFDEFDNTDQFIPIMEAGYYCTTASKMRYLDDWIIWRSDTLLKMIVANDFMYTSRHSLANVITGEVKVEDMLRCLSSEDLQVQILSSFQDPTFKNDLFDERIYPAMVRNELFASMKA